MGAGDELDVIEHQWTTEIREKRQRQRGVIVVYDQTRYVCSCGFATQWFKVAYLARSQRDRHALDGQRAHR